MTGNYHDDILIRKKIYSSVKDYCIANEIKFIDEDVDEWTKDFLSIIYSIGGTPKQATVDKMLPLYFKTILNNQ